MVREVEVALSWHIVSLMRVLNVHIEDVTVTTRVLLILLKIYHKSVNKKLTNYLISNNQEKSDAIFCLDN